MPVTSTKDDLLPHIQYQDTQGGFAAGAAQRNLAEMVAGPSGRIVIISAFGCSVVLNWQFTSSAIQLSVSLETPVGSVTLGSATIDPSNPSVTIGGSFGGFKAEATIGFNFSSMVLTFSAQVCAPILGCKSASGSLHV